LRTWPRSNTLDAVTQGRMIGKSGGELPSGFWQIFRWQPHPELAAHVRRYYGHFESSSRLVRRRELPSGEVALIISLGPHYQLVDPASGHSLGTLRSTLRSSRLAEPICHLRQFSPLEASAIGKACRRNPLGLATAGSFSWSYSNPSDHWSPGLDSQKADQDFPE
jgi:hypothetical protein